MLNLFLILSGHLSLFCESSERVACVVFAFGHEYSLICSFNFENLVMMQISRCGLVLVEEREKKKMYFFMRKIKKNCCVKF